MKYFSILSLFAVLMLGLIAPACRTWAQQQKPELHRAPIPGSISSAVADGAELQHFDDWVLVCRKGGEGPGCALLHEQTLQGEDGRSGRLIRVTLVAPGGEEKGRCLMHVLLPLGIHLPSGAAFKIDEGPQRHLVLQHCTQAGCEAATILDPDALETLRRGTTMFFGFKGNPQGDTLTVPVSLKGTQRGLNAMPIP